MDIYNINEEIERKEYLNFINESESKVKKIVSDLFSKPYNKVKQSLNKAGKDMIKKFQSLGMEDDVLNIINKSLGVNYKSLGELNRVPIKESINEGFKEWFDEAKGNAYNALAFYPLLTMFLEFDKLLKGNPDASLKVTLVYFAIWLGVISGKVISGKLSQKSKINALGRKT